MRPACRLIAALMLVSGGFGRAGEFADVASKVGLDFRHSSPLTEQRHIHLTMGSGVGWIDYDRDGRPDLYFAQGRRWDADASLTPPSDSLYQQRDGRFLDVTDAARVRNLEYAMGVAVGDFDNDGFPDLFVSSFGRNLLLQNNGDGTFTDRTDFAGLGDTGYGASCTWVDLDADGCLDLYLANYVLIDRADYTLCEEEYAGRKLPIPCPPWSYPGEADVVYRSDGHGRFSDVSEAWGFRAAQPSPGLGVAAADLDGDGDQDIYVANDAAPNFLWINEAPGVFIESAFLSGTALNRSGQREAGMGVAVGDGDGDGRFDLFVTNYFAETNTWYRNHAGGLFLDVTDEFGLAAPSRTRLGFGTVLLDVDNDADLDLFVANGHVHDRLQELGRDVPYAQSDQLLMQRGGRFHDDSSSAGMYFQTAHVGRGCAAADYNRDGLIDVVVQNLNEPAVLLENRSDTPYRSIAIELIGTLSSRDAIGAVAEVTMAQGTVTRLREGSTSYLSTNEGVLHVGLRDADVVEAVSVHWPSGRHEVWRNIDLPRGILRLREGSGAPPTRD